MISTISNHFKVIGSSIVVAVIILIFDLYLPLGVAGGVPYVVLVLIGLWSPWRYYVYLMAVIGTLLIALGYIASPEGGVLWIVITNRVLALFAIWVTAILGTRIHDSKMNLQAIVDTAAEGIVTINSSGIIISFNKAAESIFGYPADEMIGENISILMPSPDREQHDEYVANYLKTGTAKIIGQGREVTGLRGDGTKFPLHLAVSEVHRGTQRMFTGIMRDITEQKLAEDQLRKLSAIAEQIPASIIITNTHGDIEYVNPEFSIVTGYTMEEVVNKNTSILKSNETSTEEYKNLWDTITSGNIWRGELHNKKKNGELFWESVSITPVSNSKGKIINFLAVKEDITQRKQTETALRESTELLTTIIQSEPECVKRLDKHGTLLDMNPAGLKMVGADTLEQVKGMSIYELIVPEHRHRFEVLHKAVFAGESGILRFDIKGVGGNRRTVETHAVPLFNTEGEVINHLGLTHDITERLENEKQLGHAMKMEAVGRLTGSIAHDFNNLLTIILGNLQLLREDVGIKSEDIIEVIDDAISAARDSAELTEGMLTFSRKQVQQPYTININEVIDNFSRLAGRMLGETIELKIELLDGPLWTVCDPIQFDSVLLNLAINARDAMPEGGTLTIHTEREKSDAESNIDTPANKQVQYIAIRIIDTGIGMSQEVLARACEPFFTTKQEGKGSGLGLSTAYSFTEQNAGKIEIESTPKKGTTVTLLLKESLEHIKKRQLEKTNVNSLSGSETIMVVDDRAQIRKFAVRALKGLGYQVIEANSGDEALKILELENSIVLLFSDISMPGGINGYELADRALKLNKELKVLLTTGFNEEKQGNQPGSKHNFPILKKPYTKHDLTRQVRQVIERM
jgi:PAS domain S-box-containing protein